MKKLKLIAIVAIFSLGCEKPSTSYDLVGVSCQESPGTGQYKSLSECSAAMQKKQASLQNKGGAAGSGTTTLPAGYDGKISGQLDITVKCVTDYSGCKNAVTNTIKVYRKAEDRAAGLFIFTGYATATSNVVKVTGLAGGKYYYDATRTWNNQNCPGVKPLIDYTFTKTFEIKANGVITSSVELDRI